MEHLMCTLASGLAAFALVVFMHGCAKRRELERTDEGAGGPRKVLPSALIDILSSALPRIFSGRREAIERELPLALDMLTLSVEAGLDFGQALSRVASHLSGGPLSQELRQLDSAMRMGVPRATALAQLGDASASPAVSALAALLSQAERHGSGIAPALRAASARAQAARLARAERKGAVAAQMALLPLIFCIMPATFIIVFGPIAVRVATGGLTSLLKG
jgi:tight adherence protein C